jgi:response regulator RpfG family c-di-GMP phosphodiesterase
MNEIGRKILCVDDEPNVLEGLRRQLRGHFELTCAVGAQAGLAALEQQGPFAVVMADYKMPEMTGAEFLREVRRRSPHTITIMLSGCQELDVVVHSLHEGHIFRFLNKPCPRETLEAALRDCLEQHRLVVSERHLTSALQDANQQLQSVNDDLEDRVRERTATIARLYQFVSDLNGKDTVTDVAQLVVQTTAELLRSKRVSLMLPDVSGEYLTIAAAVGIDPDMCTKIRVPIGAPVAGRVFAEGRALVVNSPDEAGPENARYDGDFFAVVPLASTALLDAGQAIGVLNVTAPWSGATYDAESLATLQAVAESGTVALLNQIRLEERNEARDAVILALAKLAENRDPETGAHLERVQSYCRLLSEALARTPKYAAQITPAFVANIYRSAPLHDIGKVGIPDRILLKPGKLTPEEFDVMKTHTTIGGNTIQALLTQRHRQEFLQMGMEIAYGHHEKYDGSGYPAGIVGEQIPLSARIMALADVYDALRSRRVYKAPMSHDEAATIIRDGSGKHFDPDVVSAFLEQHLDFDRLAGELTDSAPEPQATPAEAVLSPSGANLL